MKKKFLLAVLSSLSVMAFAAGCGLGNGGSSSSGSSDTGDSSFSVSDPNYSASVEMDAGTTVDATYKASFYGENGITFTETQSGIKVTTYAHIGEKGLYLYTETTDKSVYYSTEKAFFENDSVEYYIDPQPDLSRTIADLSDGVAVRTDCVQVRINTVGGRQTWYGRYTGEKQYPWVQGYFPVVTAAKVNGEVNVANGANGYSVESFIPWEAMNLTEAPAKIGVMPAFNNVNNREDTSRTWFTVKGMSHDKLTGYAMVDANGFEDVGADILPVKELKADVNDVAYANLDEVVIKEVNASNLNPEVRATVKGFLGTDGVYFLATVKDKVYTKNSDNLWANDGIEFVIDYAGIGGGDVFRPGILRMGADVDAGYETDVCIDGYNDYVPTRKPAFVETKVNEYTGTSSYNYKYEYVYEVMVPYRALGLTEAPETLAFGWAVKSPNETAYILDRRNGIGEMEAQDWLWTDRHYPQNPGEYYYVTASGISETNNTYQFPQWAAWESCVIQADASERYNYRGYSADDGLYINAVQYVDNYVTTGDKWNNQTHIEMEVWQHNIGYGWDGTYFAFFPANDYYRNSENGITAFEYRQTVTDRGVDYNGYRYMISYEIYIGFANNLENPQDGPYAYVKLMNYMPNEDTTGFSESTKITKDGRRTLWTDDCESYRFDASGISEVVRHESAANAAATYAYTVKSGAVKADDGKLYSDAAQTLAVLDGQTLSSEGTYSARVNAYCLEGAGIVFGYSQDSYYYLMARRLDYTVRVVKVVGTTETELYSNYVSASYNVNDKPHNMWVELKDGKYYCYFWNTLHAIIPNELSGTGVGVRGEYAGSSFYNLFVTNTVAAQNVDTLIAGHSLTELWSSYKTDLSQVSGLGNVYNAGISGTHSAHWVKLTDSIIHYAPEKLIYIIGINDLFFNSATPAQISANVESVLSKAKAALPNLEVALVSLNHAFTTGAETADIETTNANYKALASKYSWIKYVDIEDAFLNEQGQAQAQWFIADGLHFSEAAYRNVIVPALNNAFNGSVFKSDTWAEWGATGTVQADANTRYNYRGYAADDGLYINMVQYVDSYVATSANQDAAWAEQTHIEMNIWQHNIGYGWGGTYLAFFADGTYYLNNNTGVKAFEYKLTVTDRGADYQDGYRYMLSYEIYIGFDNNLENPQDGPYAYIKFMSYTPNETTGYENATTITKDGWRTLWTDNCNSHQFGSGGIIGVDRG